MRTTERFTAGQASAASGVAYHQLNRWDISGLLKPSIEEANGRDSLRVYSLADVVALKVVRQLHDEGFRSEALKSVAELVQGRHYGDKCELYLIGTSGSAVSIGNGRSASATLRSREFSWILDLGAVVQEVKLAAANRVRARRGRASAIV